MMRLKRRTFAVISALLLFALLPARADDEGVRILFRSEGTAGPLWAESLASALARSTLLDSIIPCPPEEKPAEFAARLSCVLAVEAHSDAPADEDAVSRWKILDPLSGEELASGKISGPAPNSRELAEYWWLPLVEAAEGALTRVKRTLVRVSATPGTLVSGLSMDPLVIPEAGFLELSLPVPVTLPWRAVSQGAYPESGYFAALEEGLNLDIPRRPLSLWTIEAGLTMLSFPEFWAYRGFGEDRYFLRFGFAQYLLGLYLVDEKYGVDTPPAIISLPLVMPGIGLGMYFLPSDAFLRPYGFASSFARILLLSGAFGFDTVAPLGLHTALGVEWRASPTGAIFLEAGLALYPFCDGFLMAASLGNNDGGQVRGLYGEHWYIEAPLFRVGARFRL